MHTNYVGAKIVQSLTITKVAHTTRIMHIKQLYTINNLHMYILYDQGPRARIKRKKNPFKHKFKEL
jgi:hypothetical protein